MDQISFFACFKIFFSDLQRYDASLICLPEKNRHISPNDDFLTGPSCFTAGWGSTGKNEDLAKRLQSISVNVFSAEYCLRKSDYTEDVLNADVSFCAGYMTGEKDACQESASYSKYDIYINIR